MDSDIDLIFGTAKEKFVCSLHNDFFGSIIKSRDFSDILKKSTFFKTKILIKIWKIFAEKFKINDRKISIFFDFFWVSQKSAVSDNKNQHQINKEIISEFWPEISGDKILPEISTKNFDYLEISARNFDQKFLVKILGGNF